MNRGQKLRLLRQLQEVFPSMEYGDYSWKLNGQLVLETVPDALYRDLFFASFRIGGGSPWYGFQVAKWQRCPSCPLLGQRGWHWGRFGRAPRPKLSLRQEDNITPGVPHSDQNKWQSIQAACFFRCLVRRIDEILSAAAACPGMPESWRGVPAWLRQVHRNLRWQSSRRRARRAFIGWREEVEDVLSPDPCAFLRTPYDSPWKHRAGKGETHTSESQSEGELVVERSGLAAA